MFETHFFETMLDNFSDGVYILDDAGNYIFVNSAYSKLLNMPKSVLLRYNVHDFCPPGRLTGVSPTLSIWKNARW